MIIDILLSLHFSSIALSNKMYARHKRSFFPEQECDPVTVLICTCIILTLLQRKSYSVHMIVFEIVVHQLHTSIGMMYLDADKFLDMNTLIQMYYSFVFPYLIYCIEIWGNASVIHLEPLIKIQKKSIWAITFSEFSAPSEPLFQRTNILNFDKLVFQRICLMMFKNHIGDLPKPISDLFQTNNNYHSYSTRNSQSLRTPIGKSEAIYQTFTYFGSLAWNYISSKIPTDVTYICFKNIAKLHL